MGDSSFSQLELLVDTSRQLAIASSPFFFVAREDDVERRGGAHPRRVPHLLQDLATYLFRLGPIWLEDSEELESTPGTRGGTCDRDGEEKRKRKRKSLRCGYERRRMVVPRP